MRFEKDGGRYVVTYGGERIGFVRPFGRLWNTVDTTMEYSSDHATRAGAVEWLLAIHLKGTET